MNGAIALAPPNTIKMPNINKTIITGANQNFLRSRKKRKRSLRKYMIKIFNY